MDIKVKVEDPMKSTLIDKLAFFNRQDDELNEAEGRITFVATNSGVHKICFDNRFVQVYFARFVIQYSTADKRNNKRTPQYRMSRWTAKVLSFTVKNKEDKKDHEEIAKLGVLGGL